MRKNKKHKTTPSSGKVPKTPLKTAVVQRNPVALNPLLKKSHAHNDSSNHKAERSKAKQALRKRVEEE